MTFASGYQRKDWELFDHTGLIRTAISDRNEARDLVIINANPAFYAKHYTTNEEIRWEDVCAEPWPGSGAPLYEPYGEPPPDWPYGNGC